MGKTRKTPKNSNLPKLGEKLKGYLGDKNLKSILNKTIGHQVNSAKKEVSFTATSPAKEVQLSLKSGQNNVNSNVNVNVRPLPPGQLKRRLKNEELYKTFGIITSGQGVKNTKKLNMKLKHEKLLKKLSLIKCQKAKEKEEKIRKGNKNIDMKSILDILVQESKIIMPTTKPAEISAKNARKSIIGPAKSSCKSKGQLTLNKISQPTSGGHSGAGIKKKKFKMKKRHSDISQGLNYFSSGL